MTLVCFLCTFRATRDALALLLLLLAFSHSSPLVRLKKSNSGEGIFKGFFQVYRNERRDFFSLVKHSTLVSPTHASLTVLNCVFLCRSYVSSPQCLKPGGGGMPTPYSDGVLPLCSDTTNPVWE